MKLYSHHWPSGSKRDFQQDPREKIIFLHGMGGTGALWRPVAAALEEQFTILAPDQRGHGQSILSSVGVSVPGGKARATYTPLDYGRDLIETMENLQFFPAWVVGHSMGVRTACATAHLRPDWVKGLILVDLGFFGPAGGGLGDTLARFLRVLPMRFDSREQAREFMAQNCPDPSIAQYLMAVSVRSTEGALSFPFDHGALIETIRAAENVSVRGWVQEFGERGLPVLVLRGAKSLVWSHQEFEEERTRFSAFPSIRFKEIADTGHGLPFEKRQDFVQEIKNLILGVTDN